MPERKHGLVLDEGKFHAIFDAIMLRSGSDQRKPRDYRDRGRKLARPGGVFASNLV